MNLQAKRKSGSQFTADDVLEVVFNSDGKDMAEVTHTVELISGPEVTHGGGGIAGTYLHYKSHETDVDSNGAIDYSNVNIKVEQQSKGVSVIKIVSRSLAMEDVISFQELSEAYINTPNQGDLVEQPTIEPYYVTSKSGEITLSWYEDTLV